MIKTLRTRVDDNGSRGGRVERVSDTAGGRRSGRRCAPRPSASSSPPPRSRNRRSDAVASRPAQNSKRSMTLQPPRRKTINIYKRCGTNDSVIVLPKSLRSRLFCFITRSQGRIKERRDIFSKRMFFEGGKFFSTMYWIVGCNI